MRIFARRLDLRCATLPKTPRFTPASQTGNAKEET